MVCLWIPTDVLWTKQGNFNGTKKNLKAINQDKSNNLLTACFVETCCAPFDVNWQQLNVAFCTQRENRDTLVGKVSKFGLRTIYLSALLTSDSGVYVDSSV